jgi:hypothetical protein
MFPLWLDLAVIIVCVVLAIWIFIRNRRRSARAKASVDQLIDSQMGIYRGRVIQGRFFLDTCGSEHPTKPMRCQLAVDHIGVHECRGSRWYGGVVFPASSKQIDGPPKYNPYIPPKHTSREHA